MKQIVEICIGKIDRLHMESDFTFGMDAIGDSLKDNAATLSDLWANPDSPSFLKFAPMSARLVLEQSLAVLLGRFDPIRFIALIRGAESSDFVLGQQNASSFNWTRDVFPNVAVPASWWTQSVLGKEPLRTMLHGHLADYVFDAAHSTLLTDLTDWTAESAELSQWVTDLLGLERGANTLGRLRTMAKESYSSLSKGIHFEFLKGTTTAMSRSDIKQSISDAMIVVATVGLYSHYVDIALQKLPRPDAIANFEYIVKKFDKSSAKEY